MLFPLVLLASLQPSDLLEVPVTRLGVHSDSKMELFRDYLVITVPEEDYATDLDGDGALTSSVVHVVDLRTNEVVNTGLSSHAGLWRSFSDDPADPGERLVASVDGGLQVFDMRTRRTEPAISTPMDPWWVDFNEHALFYGVDETLLSFFVGHSKADLNGDGDALDGVTFRVLPGETDPSPRPAFTGRPVAMHGRRLIAAVAENGGHELNGDLYQIDTVPAVVDAVTLSGRIVPTAMGDFGVLFTSPWENSALPDATDPSWFPIRVREGAQGQTDLNGDGDHADDILHIHFPRTGRTINTGRVAGHLVQPANLPGYDPDQVPDLLLYTLWESSQGEDLNGDGAIEGSFLVVNDLAGGEHVIAREGDALEFWGRHLLFWTYDADEPVRTLGLYDTHTSEVSLTSAVAGVKEPLSSIPTYFQEVVGPFLVFGQAEEEVGADLDGDGDIEGWVLHVHDVREQVTRNLGIPVDLFNGDVLAEGNGSPRAVLGVLEAAVEVDLNGDGELSSRVLFAVDLKSGKVAGLGPGLDFHFGFLFDDDLVVQRPESFAGVDVTGDGDTDDAELIRAHIPWDELR